MAECRHALPSELGQAHALWQQVFGDEPQAQDAFYAQCAPQGPMVLVEEGRVESMLALTPVDLALPGGETCRGTYLYALATNPAARGRGYAAQLIEAAAQWTQGEGLDFVCTVPAQPSLFTFFGANGFAPAFYHHRRPLPVPTPGRAEEISPQSYTHLREQLLGGIPHIVHTPGQVGFEARLHGRLYRLDLSHGPGCAVIETWGEDHIVKELLCLSPDLEEGGALCAHLCGGRGELRTPCGWAEGTPFGAIRWLQSPPQAWAQRGRGYLGLALD